MTVDDLIHAIQSSPPLSNQTYNIDAIEPYWDADAEGGWDVRVTDPYGNDDWVRGDTVLEALRNIYLSIDPDDRYPKSDAPDQGSVRAVNTTGGGS